MTVFSYVVVKDGGFAPNPFHAVCTLACCKPKIREAASVGDIIVGLSTRSELVVYAMRVGEVMTFTDYWHDKRFLAKRPKRIARKAADRCGDNIYEPVGFNEYRQWPSQHSKPDGTTDTAKMQHDLGSLNVLISDSFAYFGGAGPNLPRGLAFLHAYRGHRSRFSPDEQQMVKRWFTKLPKGVLGAPALWRNDDDSWRTGSRVGC
jgi:hypothetical protein